MKIKVIMVDKTYEDLRLIDLAQLFHAEWVGLHIS